MAAAKLFVLLLLSLSVVLVFASGVSGDAAVEEAIGSDGVDASGFQIQVDQLNSRIRTLESQIDERTRDLEKKEEIIAGKEKTLQENLDRIASLQTAISSLQGSSDDAERLGKALARVSELEKQIDRLKKELETKNKEKESIEARTRKAEKRLSELTTSLEKLQKTSNEQIKRVRQLERGLKSAEDEMFRAKHEAAVKAKALSQAHGAWLPPWLATHWFSFQSVAETHWNNHGKPVMDVTVQKVTEKKAQFEKWAKPHLATVKFKHIPAVKKQWMTVQKSIEPQLRSLSTKAKEAYDASKAAITPHIITVQEFIDPYYQEAKKFSEPYIGHVATITKPHVDKLKKVTKPYTKKMTRAYRKFLKSARTYHHQVQATVKETLNKHELTRPLATEELQWFAASAILGLPIFILYKTISATFFRKTQRPTRHPNNHDSHNRHGRRKAKGGPSEK